MVNPFDFRTALLAKHAQHVVLIHFPIGLFITAVAFDFIAVATKRKGMAEAAYYNTLAAAISTVPVVTTGLLAWQFQLEGQKLKGILLMHLVLACVSTAMIWLVWWVHFWARRRGVSGPVSYTHLDVYKRQEILWAGWNLCVLCRHGATTSEGDRIGVS